MQRTYTGRFESSIVRFVHQGIIKVIHRCFALQSEVMKMLEDCKRERGPGTSETCREPRRAKKLVCKEITASWLIALAIRDIN